MSTMQDFMTWLRVELLRLRSFDWGPGSHRSHWLKDGVAQFTSIYPINSLASKIGATEEEIIKIIDSQPVISELEDKSFTLAWREEYITLSWLEEGIREWKTEIYQNYIEEDSKYYVEFRMSERIVYLDGTERIISDTGDPKRANITEEDFKNAYDEIRRGRDGKDEIENSTANDS